MKGYTMTQLIVHDSKGADRFLFSDTTEALDNLDAILEDQDEEPDLRVELRPMTELVVHHSEGEDRLLFADTKEALESLSTILDDEDWDADWSEVRVVIRRLRLVRGGKANRGTLRLE